MKTIAIEERCMSLAFVRDDSELIGVGRHAYVNRWPLVVKESSSENVLCQKLVIWTDTGNRCAGSFPLSGAIAAAISPDQSMVALVFRQMLVCLFNLVDHTFLGYYGERGDEVFVKTGVFNANPESRLLAVGHEDGFLAVFDVWTRNKIATADEDAYTLAPSPDRETVRHPSKRSC